MSTTTIVAFGSFIVLNVLPAFGIDFGSFDHLDAPMRESPCIPRLMQEFVPDVCADNNRVDLVIGSIPSHDFKRRATKQIFLLLGVEAAESWIEKNISASV